MNKRDMKNICAKFSNVCDEIYDENKKIMKKADSLESLKEEESAFTLYLVTMFAKAQQKMTLEKFENILYKNEKEKREIQGMINNIEERFKIIETAEDMGVEISNESFKNDLYQFVSSSEKIDFEDDEKMKDVINNLKQAWENTNEKSQVKELEYDEA